MEEYSREPCPWRIIDDCGGAFTMGVIGGGLFQLFKGYRNSPAGFVRRVAGSLEAVKRRSPYVGGSFAIWGGLFSTIDCGLIHFRQKEDPWNSIISGAATGAILSARRGIPSMITSGIVGGAIIALIEGVGIFYTRYSAEQFKPINPAVEDTSQLGPSSFHQNNFQ